MNSKAPIILLSILTLLLAGATYHFYKENEDSKIRVATALDQMNKIKQKIEGVNVDDLPSEMYTGDQYYQMKDKADFFEEQCIKYTLLIPMIEQRKNDQQLPQDLYKRVKEIEGVIKKYGYWGKDSAYKVPPLPYRKGIN